MLLFRQIITISTGYEFTSRRPQANQNDEKSRPAMHEYDQWFRSCSAFIPRYWWSYRNICLIYELTDNMNKRYHKLNNMHTMANKEENTSSALRPRKSCHTTDEKQRFSYSVTNVIIKWYHDKILNYQENPCHRTVRRSLIRPFFHLVDYKAVWRQYSKFLYKITQAFSLVLRYDLLNKITQ